MATTNRHGIYWATAVFLALVVGLGALDGCRRQKSPTTESTPPGGVKATPAANKEPVKNPLEKAADLFREPRVSIQNIVKAANERWTPACSPWWEKTAPDFTLTDIEGQTHKLSDYKGKEVIVAFWTIYAGPCKLEVKEFKELVNTLPKDKLAILVVCSEPAALVKTFATEQGINYTILTNSGSLPTPFDQVKNVPSTFFIGADGKFKVAIEGMVPAKDAKDIIQAQ
jgi:peroxiredoxin